MRHKWNQHHGETAHGEGTAAEAKPRDKLERKCCQIRLVIPRLPQVRLVPSDPAMHPGGSGILKCRTSQKS